eukprot:358275-Chlamydomonas_euryale.AAC.1
MVRDERFCLGINIVICSSLIMYPSAWCGTACPNDISYREEQLAKFALRTASGRKVGPREALVTSGQASQGVGLSQIAWGTHARPCAKPPRISMEAPSCGMPKLIHYPRHEEIAEGKHQTQAARMCMSV